jgi:N6-adenosine-specific RNA methylase IME4
MVIEELIDIYRSLYKTPRKVSVVLVDYPWRFLTRSAIGEGRSPEKKYDTKKLTYERFQTARLPEILNPDAVIVSWELGTHSREHDHLYDCWDFFPVTDFLTWIKTTNDGSATRMTQGYYTRKELEMCRLFRRKYPKYTVPKRVNRGVRQVIMAPITKHSAKPLETYERIEALWRLGGGLELFARNVQENWIGMGNHYPLYPGYDIVDSIDSYAEWLKMESVT